jgi:hypothetical protein
LQSGSHFSIVASQWDHSTGGDSFWVAMFHFAFAHCRSVF